MCRTTNFRLPVNPPMASASRSAQVRARRKSSSILRTASIFFRIALQVDSAWTGRLSFAMSGKVRISQLFCFGFPHVSGIASRADLRPGAMPLRKDFGKLSPQEKDLRRIVDPDHEDHQRPGGAIRRPYTRLSEIEADQELTDR